MAYEAQIAGVQDAPAGRPLRGLAVRGMQAVSARELAGRRAAVVAAVRAVAPLEFVNGGGTGSVERTAAEAAVTEVAAGSGLYCPVLFDGYRAFAARPAALLRRPGHPPSRRRASVTVAGGGWIASGPPGADRLPVPTYPAGLSLAAHRGRRRGADPAARPGRPRRCGSATGCGSGTRRPASSASTSTCCTRWTATADRRLPTYRGEGKAFG